MSDLTISAAVCLWEDTVGDSGELPTDAELATFANAVAAQVRAQIAAAIVDKVSLVVRRFDHPIAASAARIALQDAASIARGES